jgi:hypothetical protein
MSDQITGVQSNADGSFSFNFIFDNGAGVTGSTVVELPAPTDGSTYTLETAKAAVLSIASVQKATWLSGLNATAVVGPVTL